ncbi:hypothetical protein MRX96_011800 [Rhipicephalus microplus]
MATRVTRSQKGDGTTEDQESDRNEVSAGGCSAPELMELCVGTDEVTEGVDALLTPDTLEKLEDKRSESQAWQVQIVRAEQNATQEIDRDDEISAKEKPGHEADPTESRAVSFTGQPKQRSRTLTRRSPAKRRRESSSCARKTEVHAKPGTSGAASCDEGLALPTDLVGERPTRTSDSACQTDEFTSPLAEVKLLKCQLRATKQQLILCQTKLGKMRVRASKHKKLEESLQKMSTRTKLIFDQCVMKANAKSAKAARLSRRLCTRSFMRTNFYLSLTPRTLYTYMKNLKADFGFDANLFAVLNEKLEAVPERERRGVLMFDEMSVRKSLHVRESDMALLGKVNIAEHTRPGDNEKDADHVLVFLFRPFLGGLVANCGNILRFQRCSWHTWGQKNPQTSFQHPCDPSREIYTVIDPPHIFKCIKKQQKVEKFLLPEGDVYHDHFKSLLGSFM